MFRDLEDDCFDILRKNAPPDVNDIELRDIYETLKDGQMTAADRASNLIEKLKESGAEALDQFENSRDASEIRFWRTMEKRSVAMQLMKEFENKKDGLFNAIKSYIDGTQYNLPGTRDSAELRRHRLSIKFRGSFYHDLESEGLVQFWNSKENEVNIASAILGKKSGNASADGVGAIVRKHFDHINELYKKEGIFFETLEDRLTRNYHDPKRMLYSNGKWDQRMIDRKNLTSDQYKEKSFQRWKDFSLPRLDVAKSFGKAVAQRESGKEIDKIMRQVYKTLTNGGDYLQAPKSIAQATMQRRIMRWKDARANVEYNQKYGLDTLHAAIDAEFQKSANQISSLEFFGDNRTGFVDNLVESARESFPEMADKLTKTQFDKLKTQQAMAFGDLNDPNSKLAKISGNLMAAQNIAKLGNVMIRSLPDLAALSIDTKPLFGGYLAASADSLARIGESFSLSQQKELGRMLRVCINHDIGNSTRWVNADGMPAGMMTKAMRISFKLNGLYFWDKAIKTYSVLTHSRFLATNKNFSFEDMVKRDKKFGEFNVKTLESYGLKGADWDAMRKVPTALVKGEQYILPESAQNISDDTIKSILKKEGAKNLSPTRIAERRAKIEAGFESYLVDRSDHAILRPSASVKQGLFRNTKNSKVEGAALRWLMQFKSYPATFISKPIKRLIYGQGADSFWDAMRNGKGDFVGMAQLFTHASALGYVSIAATNLIKGLSPPDPTNLGVIRESMVIGGGAGIVGDMLGIRPSAFNKTINQLMGPQASDTGALADIFFKGLNGEFDRSSILRLGKNNLPLHNVPYIKYPLEYLILNRMQEAITPGYTRRKLRRLEEEGVTPILPQ